MTAAHTADKVNAEVLYWLQLADLDTLVGFCDEFSLTTPESKKGNNSLITNLIVRHLHSETMESLDDQGQSIFLKMQ